FYLGQAILPLDLSMIYPRWEIDPTTIMAWLPSISWGFVLLTCWFYRRSWGRLTLFALGCFTAALFPVLGFFDMYYLAISWVSDHFEYLLLACVLALIAAGIFSLRWTTISRTAMVALIAVSGLLSFQRARVFATDYDLWIDTLAKNPASWNAHNN